MRMIVLRVGDVLLKIALGGVICAFILLPFLLIALGLYLILDWRWMDEMLTGAGAVRIMLGVFVIWTAILFTGMFLVTIDEES